MVTDMTKHHARDKPGGHDCDEYIKISYKHDSGGNIFSVEQVQEHTAVLLVCLLYAGYITVNILLSQFCFCHSTESNG